MEEVIEGKNRNTFNNELPKRDDKPMQALPGFSETLPKKKS